MKKTHKHILGFLGILSVAAITAVAMALPAPQTNATTSITDTIVVKVSNGAPEVSISKSSDGQYIAVPNQNITYQYSNSDTVTITLKYTDLNGTVTTETLEDLDIGYAEGNGAINFNAANYGYGNFVFTIVGNGTEGTSSVATLSFDYVAAYGEADQTNGNNSIDIYYDPDDGSEDPSTTGKVNGLIVYVYDQNGQRVPFSPKGFSANPDGHTKVELPFEDYGLDEGTYYITIYAYDRDGNQLGNPFNFTYEYRIDAIGIPNTADTGGLFQNANISKTDYLITGLVIFGIVAVAGIVFITRHNRNSTTRSNYKKRG